MKLLTLLTSTLEGSDSSNIVELVGWKPLSLISEQYVKGRQLESKLLKRMFLSAQNLEYYFIKYISEKIFFSPVLRCTPDALPYVVVCFIFHESQPKILLRCGAKNTSNISNPFLTENVNTVLMRRPNSESGSLSELLLIPKAQDAMTSVVNLAIVSFTSTVEPENRQW